MILLKSIPDHFDQPCVATIGFFDGVHRGHCYLIEQVCAIADEKGYASAVITFPVHPRLIIHPDFHPALLTSCEEKIDRLGQTGLDYCMMLDFSAELSAFSARQFMEFLYQHYNICVLVIGYDHRFGHNRVDDFTNYLEYGKELGIEVVMAQAYADDKKAAISSSLIRNYLLEGDVVSAAARLGYNYYLDGKVVSGYRVGRKIGFPTANLCVEDRFKLVPADGVYAVHVTVAGKVYAGMLNIGKRPTLDNGMDRSIEVHILRFNSDIYDQFIRLSFIQYVRPEKKFASIEDLIVQLHKDAETVEAIL